MQLKTKMQLVGFISVIFGAFFLNDLGHAQTVDWVRYATGEGDECAYGAATDDLGNLYVTGKFNGPSMTFDSQNSIVGNGSNELYITKYDRCGDVMWVNHAIGLADDQGINVNTAGEFIYLTGWFDSGQVMFTSKDGNNQTIQGVALSEGFIATYNSNGNLLSLTLFTAAGYQGIRQLDFDAAGNMYVYGYTYSAFEFNNQMISDIFLIKYNPAGGIEWIRDFGGSGEDIAGFMVTDDFGNSYMVGSSYSQTIDFGTTTMTPNNQNGGGFLVKYDTDGNFKFFNSLDGDGYDYAFSVETDSKSNIYVALYTYSSIVDLGNGFSTNNKGWVDAVCVKYDPNGVVLDIFNPSGPGYDIIDRILIDSNDHIFISARYYNTTMTIGDISISSNDGYTYSLLAKLNNFDNPIWIKSNLLAYAYGGLALGNNSDIFMTGNYWNGQNFDSFSVKIFDGDILISPTNEQIIEVTTPTFFWTPIEDSNGYTLTIAQDGSPIFTETGITGTTYTLPIPLNEGSYTWSLGVDDPCNATRNSLTWSFSVLDPDYDGDGVLNELDNCPNTQNPNQEDLDGDSVGDVCDSDVDGDGYDVTNADPSLVDCDDLDPTFNPGALDIPYNGIDENCDGQDAIIVDITEPLRDAISEIPDGAFKNSQKRAQFYNNVSSIETQADQGNFCAALNATNNLLNKNNGCVTGQAPNKADFIQDCDYQVPVYETLLELKMIFCTLATCGGC